MPAPAPLFVCLKWGVLLITSLRATASSKTLCLYSAEHMIFGVEGTDPVRREKLIELLDIDLKWRMHKVSDGQRRRVQICMGLLHPFKVLLLDEVTVDLDVVPRMDLLDFFKEECEQVWLCIIDLFLLKL
ncbi:ABC transporter I family member 19 [Rosa chinensis]|nr:ABC transporter I family member 19 [Rosa chinensis]